MTSSDEFIPLREAPDHIIPRLFECSLCKSLGSLYRLYPLKCGNCDAFYCHDCAKTLSTPKTENPVWFNLKHYSVHCPCSNHVLTVPLKVPLKVPVRQDFHDYS